MARLGRSFPAKPVVKHALTGGTAFTATINAVTNPGSAGTGGKTVVGLHTSVIVVMAGATAKLSSGSKNSVLGVLTTNWLHAIVHSISATAIACSAVSVRGVQHTMAGTTVAIAGSLTGKTALRIVASSLVKSSGSRATQLLKTMTAAAFTFTASRQVVTSKNVSGTTVVLAGARSLAVFRSTAAVCTTVIGTIGRGLTRSVTAVSSTFAGSRLLLTGKGLSGVTAVLSGSRLLAAFRSVAAVSSTVGGTTSHGIVRSAVAAVSIAFNGALSAVKGTSTYMLSIAATLPKMAATQLHAISRYGLASSSSMGVAVIKSCAKTAVSTSAKASASIVHSITTSRLAVSASMTGAVQRSHAKTVSSTTRTSSGAVTRSFVRGVIAATLVLSALITRNCARVVSGIVATNTAAIRRGMQRTVAALASLISSVQVVTLKLGAIFNVFASMMHLTAIQIKTVSRTSSATAVPWSGLLDVISQYIHPKLWIFVVHAQTALATSNIVAVKSFRSLGIVRQAVFLYRRFTVAFSATKFDAPVLLRRWKL